MSKKNNRYKYNNRQSSTLLPLLPIALALALVPLIVRLKVLTVPNENVVWYTDPLVQLVDIFAYYKGALLIACAMAALLTIGWHLLDKDYDFLKSRPFYLLYGYIGLVIIAFIVSTNHSVSFTGYNERYENAFVLLAYIILFIYTTKAVNQEEQFRFLIYCWIGAIAIMFLIGLSQYLGHDFFTTSFGMSLIIPAKYAGATASQDSDTVRNVYQTLFHYNYVSFYASIGLPFFLILSFLEKDRRRKLIYIAVTAIFAFNQYASLSRNGYFGIFIAVIVAFIFLRNRLLKRWYLFLPVLAVVLIAGTVFIASSDSRTASSIRLAIEQALEKENYPLNNITTENSTLVVDHDAFNITVVYDEDVPLGEFPFNFSSSDGTLFNLSETGGEKQYSVDGIDTSLLLCQYEIQGKIETLTLTIDGTKWPFAFIDKNFVYINPHGRYDTLRKVDTFGFAGRLKFGSARGYIWSRTIPLFKEYGLIGSGPDTFALVFPQHDYVGKYIAYDTANMVVDKPHNLYLNYAINTGIPSLLLVLAFWLYYIGWSFNLYIKSDFDSFYSHIGLASLVAVIGYLSSGIFNDTNLNVTPTFWIILGLGYTANLLYQKQEVKH